MKEIASWRGETVWCSESRSGEPARTRDLAIGPNVLHVEDVNCGRRWLEIGTKCGTTKDSGIEWVMASCRTGEHALRCDDSLHNSQLEEGREGLC